MAYKQTPLDKAIDNVFISLRKQLVLVGKVRVASFLTWFMVGFAVGVVSIMFYAASRGGGLSGSLAARNTFSSTPSQGIFGDVYSLFSPPAQQQQGNQAQQPDAVANNPAAAAQHCSVPAGASFGLGDRVQALISVRIRSVPGVSSPEVQTGVKAPIGATGVITCSSGCFSLPQTANSYSWWYIDWDNASLPTGWSAEGSSEADYLVKTGSGGGTVCTPGATQTSSCSTPQHCPGTQVSTCNTSGTAWGGGQCVDVPNDNCPATNTNQGVSLPPGPPPPPPPVH